MIFGTCKRICVCVATGCGHWLWPLVVATGLCSRFKNSFLELLLLILLLTYFYLFYFLPLEMFFPLFFFQVRGGRTDQLFGGEFCVV